MGRITLDQSHQVMAVLATNTDWDAVDFTGLQDSIIRNPKGAGTAFTVWLKSGATIEAVAQAPLPQKKNKNVLSCVGELTVGPLQTKFVRREFFRTRSGLYLWNDMERVLSVTHDADSPQPVKTLQYHDLGKNAHDRDIKAQLPEKQEVELWQVAWLIERQKDGEEGVLLTNGYANIFYVAGFAVGVGWNAGNREWVVSVWKLGGDDWRRGDRVFSGN